MDHQIAKLDLHHRPRRLLLLAALLSLTLSASARADLIIVAEPAVANPGSNNNTMEMVLTNTGPGAVTIGGFSFGVSVAGTDINFTRADINTATATYIFNGHSVFGPTISTQPPALPGPSLKASDLDANPAGTSLSAATTVGLGRLFFDVSPSAALGAHTVTIEPFPTTSLSDPSANDVPITTLVNGQILVNTPIVPEPAALWSALIALAGAGGWVGARHQQRKRSGRAKLGKEPPLLSACSCCW